MIKKLPPQRAKVFQFCQNEIAAGRPFPSAGQVTQFMGWRQTGSAGDALFKLCWYDKVLTRTPNGKYEIAPVAETAI